MFIEPTELILASRRISVDRREVDMGRRKIVREICSGLGSAAIVDFEKFDHDTFLFKMLLTAFSPFPIPYLTASHRNLSKPHHWQSMETQTPPLHISAQVIPYSG